MVPSSCDAGEEHLGSVRGVGHPPLPYFFVQSPERIEVRVGLVEVLPSLFPAFNAVTRRVAGHTFLVISITCVSSAALVAFWAEGSGEAVANVGGHTDGVVQREGYFCQHGGALQGGGLRPGYLFFELS